MMCEYCIYYNYTCVKITGINTGDPPEEWCDKGSEHFLCDEECEDFKEDKYER